MKALSILVLAFNEEGNLAGAVEDIQRAALVLDEYEIIIVDDGSTDGTHRVADSLAARDCHIRAIHHSSNQGLRAGYESGLSEATLDRVIWLPADREMTYESIRAIFQAVGTADIVSIYHGNPEKRQWFRRFLTWGSTLEMNVLFGHRLRYFQGTNVYATTLARRLPRTERGFFVMAEQFLAALESGPSVVEIPITHQERVYGVSKAVSFGRIWSAQIAVLRFWARFRLGDSPVHPALLEVPHG